ncbi:hypothetical protein HK098_000988 [Nowakowskiella sp. JEL0407]|nr:hypothetical protein HK098_000988 [Nowakowskiella sp. JEL0407]
MTRVHEDKKTSAKDRHQQRNGHQGDIKGVPKKSGAGKGNWGALDDRDLQDEYYEEELSGSPPIESKIKVVPRE